MGDSRAIEPAAQDEVELRLLRHERLRLSGWFVPFAILMALVACVYLLGGEGSTAAALAMLLAYLSLACTFLPLPTAWIVILAAIPAAKGGLGLNPWVVASVGAVGTAIANLHDYYLLTFLYRYKPVRRIRMTGLYKRFAVWYNRAPFGTLAAASFLPIPVDFVRLLAVSEGYNRAKFVLGSLVGRWPRYLLLAYLADRFDMTWQWVLGIGGATVVLGLWRGLPPLAQRIGRLRRAKHSGREGTRP